jgi:hypothetical protein
MYRLVEEYEAGRRAEEGWAEGGDIQKAGDRRIRDPGRGIRTGKNCAWVEGMYNKAVQ